MSFQKMSEQEECPVCNSNEVEVMGGCLNGQDGALMCICDVCGHTEVQTDEERTAFEKRYEDEPPMSEEEYKRYWAEIYRGGYEGYDE